MQILDNSKSIRQEQAIDCWKDHGCIGTFNHIMRFGKTHEIKLIIERTRQVHPEKRIIMLVPTEVAYQNVARISKQFNVETYTRFTFLNQLENPTFDKEAFLYIIDEIHAFLKDKDIPMIKSIKSNFRLGLTGAKLTVQDKGKLKLMGFPVIDVITEEEAILKKWITDYDEYNVAVEISDAEKRRYKALNDKIVEIVANFKGIYKLVNSRFKTKFLDSDFDLIQACYTGKNLLNNNFEVISFVPPDKLRLIVATLQGFVRDAEITNEYTRKIQTTWNPSNIQEMAKAYVKAVAARNAYLKHNVSKVNAVIKLSEKIKVPTIVYNDSVDMIEQLSVSVKVPNVKYHSAIESTPLCDEDGNIITYVSGSRKGEPKLFGKKTLKKLAIEAISTNKAMYLITGRSLNESLNLPNIECIICTSGDTNPNTYDQRVARGKTIDLNNEHKKCTIINLYIDDFIIDYQFVNSRDKEKLVIRQTNVKNVVWLENIDDLISLLKTNH